MKIDVSKLSYTKQVSQAEEVVFDPQKYVCHIPLVNVLSCKANVKIQRFEEFIYMTLSINAKVTLQCSYSLKNFETTLKGEEELHFANFVEEDDDDTILYKGNVIDLDDYIFNLLSACVPISPKAPNAKIPSDGKGYRVISDSELMKEKKETGNSKFDCLKDLDLN